MSCSRHTPRGAPIEIGASCLQCIDEQINKLDFNKVLESHIKPKDLGEFISTAQKCGDTIISVEYGPELTHAIVRYIRK